VVSLPSGNVMPGFAPLDVLPLWALSVALFAANLLLDECGFRVGRLRGRQSQKEGDATVSTVVAAELGLLAFLLAFSFGIAASRFDLRRQMVLEEANAIGTTFLRSAMLPDAQGESIRGLLRTYTDVRLEATMGVPIDRILRRSEQLHQQMWSEAVAAAEYDPRSVPVGLFIQSLNQLIDLHTARVMAALRSRLPLAVWIVLFTVGLLAFFTMGYQAGLTTASRSPAAIVLALTFGAVIWLVADLDRPSEGFLRVSQEPMIEVRKMMGNAP
jgi:hypothetical protein